MTVGKRGPVGGIAGPAPVFPMYCEEITPDNDEVFPEPVAVWVHGAGNIKVDPFGKPGEPVTITVAAEQLPFMLPFMVRKVYDDDTTATDIYGIW